MTRKKKTRSLADRVNIKTGRKKDLVRHLQEQRKRGGDKTSLSPHALKRKKQRKLQAARRQARLEQKQQDD